MTFSTERDEASTLIYLDWCVIEELRTGGMHFLLDKLASFRLHFKLLIPFTATHVTEATNVQLPEPEKEKLIQEKLTFLSLLTNNLYYYSGADVNSVSVRFMCPQLVRETLSESKAEWANEQLVKMMNELVPAGKLQESREQFGLDPKWLSNTPEQEVFRVLDKVLQIAHSRLIIENAAYREAMEKHKIEMTVKGLVDASLKFNPDHETFGDSIRFTGLYTMIDILGFRPDMKLNHKMTDSMFSVVRDSDHAYHASFTEMFVTSDQKLAKKAAAVFHELGKSTLVVNPDKAANILDAWESKLADEVNAEATSKIEPQSTVSPPQTE